MLFENTGKSVKDLDEYPFADPYLPTLDLAYQLLTSLDGCPETVSGNFRCSMNALTTLKYARHTVGGDFNCNFNQLTSLKYCPTIVGNDFFCDHNKIKTLVGVSEDLKQINGTLSIIGNDVKTGGIELIFVKGLRQISSKIGAFTIISRYLGTDNIYDCHAELLKYNFERYAEL